MLKENRKGGKLARGLAGDAQSVKLFAGDGGGAGVREWPWDLLLCGGLGLSCQELLVSKTMVGGAHIGTAGCANKLT